MNAADRRRLTPAFGIIAAILVVLLIALWVGLGEGATWNDNAAPTRLPSVGATTPAPAVPPLDRYAEVWQRPLFSPTRTPAPATPGEGASSSDLQLTGVIMLPHLRMAILHDKTNGRDYRAIEGQPSRDGPVLVELHPRSAVIEVSGSRQELQLVPGPAPNPGTPPPNGFPNPDEQQGEQGEPVPMSAGSGASAMVTRRGMQDSGGQPVNRSPTPTAGAQSAAARARALKARIDAQRRRAAHQDGGG
jgi:general secretion pathway protein N